MTQLEVFPSAKIDMDIPASADSICPVHPSEEARRFGLLGCRSSLTAVSQKPPPPILMTSTTASPFAGCIVILSFSL
jgi:hypothetical protein